MQAVECPVVEKVACPNFSLLGFKKVKSCLLPIRKSHVYLNGYFILTLIKNMKNDNIIRKITAILLIASFLAYDISWAYPDNHLRPPAIFNPLTPEAADIAKLKIGAYMHLKGRVAPSGLKISFGQPVATEDGSRLLLLPCSIEDRQYIARIRGQEIIDIRRQGNPYPRSSSQTFYRNYRDYYSPELAALRENPPGLPVTIAIFRGRYSSVDEFCDKISSVIPSSVVANSSIFPPEIRALNTPFPISHRYLEDPRLMEMAWGESFTNALRQSASGVVEGFKRDYIIESAASKEWVPVVEVLKDEPPINPEKYVRLKKFILSRLKELKAGDKTNFLSPETSEPIKAYLQDCLKGEAAIDVKAIHDYLKAKNEYEKLLLLICGLTGVQRYHYEDTFALKADLQLTKDDVRTHLEGARWQEYMAYLAFFTAFLKDREYAQAIADLVEEGRTGWRTQKIRDNFIPLALGSILTSLSRATDGLPSRTEEAEGAALRKLLETNGVPQVSFLKRGTRKLIEWPKDGSLVLPGFVGRVRMKSPRQERVRTSLKQWRKNPHHSEISEGGAFICGMVRKTPVIFHSGNVEVERIEAARGILQETFPALKELELYRLPAGYVTVRDGSDETMVGNNHIDTGGGILPAELFTDGKPRFLIDPYFYSEIKGNDKYDFDLFLGRHGGEVEVVLVDEDERHFNPANFACIFIEGRLKVLMNYAPKTIARLPFREGVLISPARAEEGMCSTARKGGSYGCLVSMDFSGGDSFMLPAGEGQELSKTSPEKVWKEDILRQAGVEQLITVFKHTPDYSGIDQLLAALGSANLPEAQYQQFTASLRRVKEEIDPARRWQAVDEWVRLLNELLLAPINRLILVEPKLATAKRHMLWTPVHQLFTCALEFPAGYMGHMVEWWVVDGAKLPVVYLNDRFPSDMPLTGAAINVARRASLFKRLGELAQGRDVYSTPLGSLLHRIWPANMGEDGARRLARLLIQETRREALRGLQVMRQIMPQIISLALRGELLTRQGSAEMAGLKAASKTASLFFKSALGRYKTAAAFDIYRLALHAAIKASCLSRLRLEDKPGDLAQYELLNAVMSHGRKNGPAQNMADIYIEVYHQILEEVFNLAPNKKAPSKPTMSQIVERVARLSPPERQGIAEKIWDNEFTPAGTLKLNAQRPGLPPGSNPEDVSPKVVDEITRLARASSSGAQSVAKRFNFSSSHDRRSSAGDNAIPAMIGGYKVLEEIGKKERNVFYKASKPITPDDIVFIKKRRDPEKYAKFFKQEVYIMERLAPLELPFIPRLIEIGPDWIAMEYVDGESIYDWALRASRNPREVLEVIAKLLDDLHRLHQEGVVHSDVVPANIFITKGQIPKLLDFEIAHTDEKTVFDNPNFFYGTVKYVAPELIYSGTKPTRQSDICQAGLMLYEIATGELDTLQRTGSSQLSLTDLVRQIANAPTPAKGDIQRRLLWNWKSVDGLAEVIAKAIAKDPNERYRSAAGMASAIRGLLSSEEGLIGVRIEPAVEADLDAILELSRKVLQPVLTKIKSGPGEEKALEEAFIEHMRSVIRKEINGAVIVARHNEKVIGFAASFITTDPKEAHLGGVAVDPAWQDKGLGKGIFRRWFNEMKKIRDIETIVVEDHSGGATGHIAKGEGFAERQYDLASFDPEAPPVYVWERQNQPRRSTSGVDKSDRGSTSGSQRESSSKTKGRRNELTEEGCANALVKLGYSREYASRIAPKFFKTFKRLGLSDTLRKIYPRELIPLLIDLTIVFQQEGLLKKIRRTKMPKHERRRIEKELSSNLYNCCGLTQFELLVYALLGLDAKAAIGSMHAFLTRQTEKGRVRFVDYANDIAREINILRYYNPPKKGKMGRYWLLKNKYRLSSAKARSLRYLLNTKKIKAKDMSTPNLLNLLYPHFLLDERGVAGAIYATLGEIYCQLGRYDPGFYDTARLLASKAAEWNPNCANTYILLGNIFSDIGEPNKALGAYRKAIRLNPHCALGYGSLARIYSESGNYRKALEYSKKAARLAPTSSVILSLLGWEYQMAGRLKEAAQFTREAIKMDTNNWIAYASLGYIFLDLKMEKQSVASLAIAASLNPGRFKKATKELLRVYKAKGKKALLNVILRAEVERHRSAKTPAAKASAGTPERKSSSGDRERVTAFALGLKVQPDIKSIREIFQETLRLMIHLGYPHSQVLKTFIEALSGLVDRAKARYDGTVFVKSMRVDRFNTSIIVGVPAKLWNAVLRRQQDLTAAFRSPDIFIETTAATLIREAWGYWYIRSADLTLTAMHSEIDDITGQRAAVAIESGAIDQFLSERKKGGRQEDIIRLTADIFAGELFEGLRHFDALDWAKNRGLHVPALIEKPCKTINKKEWNAFRKPVKTILETKGEPIRLLARELRARILNILCLYMTKKRGGRISIAPPQSNTDRLIIFFTLIAFNKGLLDLKLFDVSRRNSKAVQKQFLSLAEYLWLKVQHKIAEWESRYRAEARGSSSGRIIEVEDGESVETKDSNKVLKASLQVCLAVAAYNTKTGARRIAHFLDNGHLKYILSKRFMQEKLIEEYNQAKERYISELLKDISGADWQAVVCSVSEPGYLGSDVKIAANELRGWLIHRNGIPKENIRMHEGPKGMGKAVILEDPGEAYIYKLDEKGYLALGIYKKTGEHNFAMCETIDLAAQGSIRSSTSGALKNEPSPTPLTPAARHSSILPPNYEMVSVTSTPYCSKTSDPDTFLNRDYESLNMRYGGELTTRIEKLLTRRSNSPISILFVGPGRGNELIETKLKFRDQIKLYAINKEPGLLYPDEEVEKKLEGRGIRPDVYGWDKVIEPNGFATVDIVTHIPSQWGEFDAVIFGSAVAVYIKDKIGIFNKLYASSLKEGGRLFALLHKIGLTDEDTIGESPAYEQELDMEAQFRHDDPFSRADKYFEGLSRRYKNFMMLGQAAICWEKGNGLREIPLKFVDALPILLAPRGRYESYYKEAPVAPAEETAPRQSLSGMPNSFDGLPDDLVGLFKADDGRVLYAAWDNEKEFVLKEAGKEAPAIMRNFRAFSRRYEGLSQRVTLPFSGSDREIDGTIHFVRFVRPSTRRGSVEISKMTGEIEFLTLYTTSVAGAVARQARDQSVITPRAIPINVDLFPMIEEGKNEEFIDTILEIIALKQKRLNAVFGPGAINLEFVSLDEKNRGLRDELERRFKKLSILTRNGSRAAPINEIPLQGFLITNIRQNDNYGGFQRLLLLDTKDKVFIEGKGEAYVFSSILDLAISLSILMDYPSKAAYYPKIQELYAKLLGRELREGEIDLDALLGHDPIKSKDIANRLKIPPASHYNLNRLKDFYDKMKDTLIAA